MKTIINFLIKILAVFTPKRFVHFLTYETVSYLLFGGLTTVVGLGSFAVFYYYFGMSGAMSGALSNVLGIVFAFFTNKIFVFESPSWQPGVLLPELAKFGASRGLTSVLDILALRLLVDMLGLNAMLMRLLTMVIIQFIGNYVLSKWVVFTHRPYTHLTLKPLADCADFCASARKCRRGLPKGKQGGADAAIVQKDRKQIVVLESDEYKLITKGEENEP